MGPLPDLDHVLRFVLSGSVQGHPWVSVQHLQFQGARPDAASLQTLATSIGTSWLNAIGPTVDNLTTLATTEVTDLTDKFGSQVTQPTPHNGTHTEPATLPSSACWVQSLSVDFRYRGGHPRIYWPYTDATGIVNGSAFSQGAQALIGTAATGWITNLNNLLLNGLPLKHGAAFYYTHDPATKVRMYRNPPFFKPTTATSVHKRLDTQRRRLGAEVP